MCLMAIFFSKQNEKSNNAQNRGYVTMRINGANTTDNKNHCPMSEEQ